MSHCLADRLGVLVIDNLAPLQVLLLMRLCFAVGVRVFIDHVSLYSLRFLLVVVVVGARLRVLVQKSGRILGQMHQDHVMDVPPGPDVCFLVAQLRPDLENKVGIDARTHDDS